MKRFKIYERISGRGSKGPWSGFAEVIFAYPNFKSLQEGLDWIRDICDPECTGHYGIVDCS